MAVVVPIDHPDIIAVDLQQGDGGVVAVGRFAHLGERQAVQRAQHHPHGRAVAEHGDGLAVVLRRHPLQGGDVAIQHLLCRLAALHVELVQLAVEVKHLLLIGGVQLLPGTALPAAHVNLPEGGLQMQLQPLRLIDGPGGGAGPEQVAAVHRVNVYVVKALFQYPELLIAPVGDQAVVLAVGDAVEVALRLGVADQINSCHSTFTHAFISLTAAPTSPPYCRL